MGRLSREAGSVSGPGFGVDVQRTFRAVGEVINKMLRWFDSDDGPEFAALTLREPDNATTKAAWNGPPNPVPGMLAYTNGYRWKPVTSVLGAKSSTPGYYVYESRASNGQIIWKPIILSKAGIQDTLDTDLTITRASNPAANGPWVILKRARGTLAAPTLVVNGDSAGALIFKPHDGATYTTTAAIEAAITGVASAGNVPTSLTFGTGTASAIERMRITSDGLIWMGALVDDGTGFRFQVTGGGSFSGQVRAGAPSTALWGLTGVDLVAGSGAIIGNVLGLKAAAAGANHYFFRTRGTFASPTAVQSGDNMGQFVWNGLAADGTTYTDCAAIQCTVPTTVGATYVPSVFRFLTTDAAGTLAQRLEVSYDLITASIPIVTTGYSKAATAIETGVVTTTAAGDVTMADDHRVVVCAKTVAATFVVYLTPTPVAGQRATVKDARGDGAAFNITVSGNGNNIDGAAFTLIATNWGYRELLFEGGIWLIVGSA